MNGIGWAVKQMQDGMKVRRAGWNGKGMFLFLVRRLNDDYLNGFMRKGDDLIVRRPERFVPFAA